MSATTMRRRRQRPREATPAAGAWCDLATRGEDEHRRERRPEVPTCQVGAAAGTTEVVAWRARGALGLLALGTVAVADAGIGVAVCFVYYQVARRSMLALAAWPICVGALVLAAAFHGTIEVLALEMVAASAALVVGLGIPSLGNALLSLANDTASLPRQAILLEPATMDRTVVAPCRDVGATRLAIHLRRLCDVLGGTGLAFEVVPVSDELSDGSERAFDELRKELVWPIVWSDNRGQGAALDIGLAHGHDRCLGLIDADSDIPADGLAPFVAVVRRQQPDVVVGSKRHPQAHVVLPPLRRVYSTGYQYQWLPRLPFGLRVRDTQTGVKLVPRNVVAQVLPRMGEKRFAFDLELLAVAHRLEYRQVAELPVVIGQRFSAAWVADGDQVTWFCAAVDGPRSMEQVDGITVIRDSVYRQARLLYLRQGRGRYDLVVDEVNTRPFEAARWAAGTPVVALVHQVAREVWFHELAWPVATVGHLFCEPRWLRRLRSVPVLTVSASSAASLAGSGLVEVAVVPKGVDHVVLPDVARAEVATVVFVGRMTRNKLPDHVVAAFRLLHPHAPDGRLWMIGVGPIADQLRRDLPDGVVVATGTRAPGAPLMVAVLVDQRCHGAAVPARVSSPTFTRNAPSRWLVPVGMTLALVVPVFPMMIRSAPAMLDAPRAPVAVSCETRLRTSRCVLSGRKQTGIGSSHAGRRAGRAVLPPPQGVSSLMKECTR